MEDLGEFEYPVALGLAYLFLGGYLLRTLFVFVGLPASVGVMFSGFFFSYFSQCDILAARDDLQEYAFFLVLLIAGLEIDVNELRPATFIMAWMPACMEIVGISSYGYCVLGYAVIESMVLASVLVALGDGLVIPRMKEFMDAFPKHPLPRLVFMWAPLEASFALTTFGILTGFASPAHTPPTSMGMVLFSSGLRIVATVMCGMVLGCFGGLFIPNRVHFTVRGRPLFNGSSVEGFLLVLALMLFAFALGKGGSGHELVPMMFCTGSLFQPELLVIVTGTVFGYFCDAEVLHEIEYIMGGVWVFGQLVLFSMLGSRTSPDILPQLVHVVPIMLSGWVCRFVGVFLGVLYLAWSRSYKTYSHVMPDAVFCFLSTLPRATIQGALGAVPMKRNFFSHGYTSRLAVQEFIFVAARLYIITTAIGGMILLNFFGPKMLALSQKAHEDNGFAEPEYDASEAACGEHEDEAPRDSSLVYTTDTYKPMLSTPVQTQKLRPHVPSLHASDNTGEGSRSVVPGEEAEEMASDDGEDRQPAAAMMSVPSRPRPQGLRNNTTSRRNAVSMMVFDQKSDVTQEAGNPLSMMKSGFLKKVMRR